MARKKHTCPVCGYRTLPARYDWDICPVCLWEDDLLETQGDRRSSANHMLLSEAQANFILHGAVTPEMSRHVRPPKPDEPRDPNWRLLPGAEQHVNMLHVLPR
jgi:hypothetical protein